MREHSKRLTAIEKRLMPDSGATIQPPVIIGFRGRRLKPADEKLGPAEGWVTYQEQLRAQEAANAEYVRSRPGCIGCVIEINLNVDQEYEARRRPQEQAV